MARHAIVYVTAAALYAAAVCAILAPTVTHLSTSVPVAPSDATATIRDYWAANTSHRTPFTFSEDKLQNAPEGIARQTAIEVANAVQPGVVFYLGRLIGMVAAWNLFSMAGLVATALATFWFLLRYGATIPSAFFGGYVFGLSPWQFEQLITGHAALTYLWTFPLVLAILAGRPTWKRGAVAGLLMGVTFYTHSYLGAIVVVLALVAILTTGLLRRDVRSRVVGLGGPALATLVLTLLPAAVAGLLARKTLAKSFPVPPADYYGILPSNFFIPDARNPLYRRFLNTDGWPPPHTGEAVAFYGYVTIALATGTVALWAAKHDKAWRVRSLHAIAVVSVVAGILLALPGSFQAFGTLFHGPGYFVGHITNSFKIWARFSVLAGLGFTILAASALTTLQRWSKVGAVIASMVLAAVFVELAPGDPVPAWRTDTSGPITQWLRRHPGGIVAQYPMMEEHLPPGKLAGWGDYSSTVLFDQTIHRHPLFATWNVPLNGSHTESIRLLASDIQAPLTARILRTEHVRFVVIRRGEYTRLGLSAPAVRRSLFHPVFRRGDTTVYTVHARTVSLDNALANHEAVIAKRRGVGNPAVKFASGWLGPEPYEGGTRQWMRTRGTLHVRETDSGYTGMVPFRLTMFAFSNRIPRTITVSLNNRVLAKAVVQPFDQEIKIGPFNLPAYGVYDLVLKSSPPAAELGSTDPRVASIYVGVPQLVLAD